MMEEMWNQNLMLAKYHYSVCERLFENFRNYETKRFLSAAVKEGSMALMHLINSLIIYEDKKRKSNLRKKPFELFKKIAPKYFLKEKVENVLTLIKIKKDQKESPIEILRGDKILYLIKGEYRTLTYDRLNEIIKDLDYIIKNFPKD